MSLAEALERAADALPERADAIWPANGDPERLLDALDADGAAEVLGWLLREAAADGQELAMAWAEDEAGTAALLRVPTDDLPKAGRKALRRAHHRLRSRGVAVDEGAAEPVVARLPRLEDGFGGAFVSAPDPRGAQFFVRMDPNPSGGARVFQGILDCGRGLLEFRVFEVNRSDARRFERAVLGDARLRTAAVSREALAALLAEAVVAQPADRVLPAAFSEWRSRIAAVPEGTPTPGAEARAAFESGAEASQLAAAAELVTKGELGPWPPEPEAMQAFAEKLREAASSRIVVGEQQRRERLEEELGSILEQHYDEAERARTARRLEETAHAWWRAGREDDARVCVAAAVAFREREPRDNPVARALLGRAVEPVLEALPEDEEDSTSLLVEP